MLSVKKILIPIQGTPLSESTLTTAYYLSKNYNAHLAVIHIQPDRKDLIPLTSEGLSGSMIEEVMNIAASENQKRLKLAREIFDNFIDKYNIELTDPDLTESAKEKITASFTNMVGRENELITYWARLSDITVISHPDSDSEISSSEALHTLLFDSGRPIIIAPKQKPLTTGKKICICWNGSAESAAALHASLRWLHYAEQVYILYTNDYENHGKKIQDVVNYLKFHNIQATPHQLGNDRDVGNTILSTCNEIGADMLCMGAYSHPRWQQLILGGVTRYMLENANISVLMNR
ncbi:MULTISPECIES: universal stress protein [unclassified Commensalibacter]|uniref:universal stress protein n=1 Tax=unclassified Commensalibacter TaxID=2630218 RepID=UPI0018DE27DE|nr:MULTISPECIES: universal stress protein [unclassified Commensalibacter]MBH9970154.1 universal stress protein [Commensalibacter sp. M0265]MBH9977660.1 universal stress protein [Commensalibacter sp. M0266]MBH9993189.1 universal stress protein [Commensalibacter sp. M0270]MBI0046836.1 universal stress protein [Commensalibacter sp. M0267]MBI0056354.1 universal stress protein [Commensalibacter sp. M0268]